MYHTSPNRRYSARATSSSCRSYGSCSPCSCAGRQSLDTRRNRLSLGTLAVMDSRLSESPDKHRLRSISCASLPSCKYSHRCACRPEASPIKMTIRPGACGRGFSISKAAAVTTDDLSQCLKQVKITKPTLMKSPGVHFDSGTSGSNLQDDVSAISSSLSPRRRFSYLSVQACLENMNQKDTPGNTALKTSSSQETNTEGLALSGESTTESSTQMTEFTRPAESHMRRPQTDAGASIPPVSENVVPKTTPGVSSSMPENATFVVPTIAIETVGPDTPDVSANAVAGDIKQTAAKDPPRCTAREEYAYRRSTDKEMPLSAVSTTSLQSRCSAAVPPRQEVLSQCAVPSSDMLGKRTTISRSSTCASSNSATVQIPKTNAPSKVPMWRRDISSRCGSAGPMTTTCSNRSRCGRRAPTPPRTFSNNSSSTGTLGVGTSVRIVAPKDKYQPSHEAGLPRFIVAVVVYVTADGQYKIGTTKGIIGRLFSREELQVRDRTLIRASEVPRRPITVLEASTMSYASRE